MVPSLLQLPRLALPAAADLGKPYFWGLHGGTRTPELGPMEMMRRSFFSLPREVVSEEDGAAAARLCAQARP